MGRNRRKRDRIDKHNRKREQKATRRQPWETTNDVVWVVAFLDMLGYTRALDELDVDPSEPPADQSVEQANEALTRIVRLRGRFRDMFGKVAPDMPVPGVGRLPEIKREDGPDNIILACAPPVDEGCTRLRVYSLLGMLSDVAVSMLIQLAVPDENDLIAPIRGGIDVALGKLVPRTRSAIGDPDKSDLFTPALTRAYELESKVASIARTVVGRRFLKLVEEMSVWPLDSPSVGIVRSGAKQIQQLLFLDTFESSTLHQGQMQTSVDFFGEHICSHWHPNDESRRLGRDAWDNARRGLDRNAKDDRVAPEVRVFDPLYGIASAAVGPQTVGAFT